MFVSFEGIDGSGKSTQARLLADTLRQRGRTVVETREPGGTGLGESIRSLLLDPDAHLVPRAELLLFSAARAQLVSTVVRPALAAGTVVIADRFFDSSTAYQGGGRRIASPAWLEAHHAFVTGGLVPARTYLIDLDPAAAASRRGSRPKDRMEQGDGAYYGRIRIAYLALAALHSERIVTLDGTLPTDDLHRLVVEDFDEQTSIHNESPATRSE